MTELVNYQEQGGVATLTLHNGKANAISPQVIAQMSAALDRAEQAKAVVCIKGQPGIFSAGYDLNVMHGDPQGIMALVQAGSRLSRRLLSFPYPVMVACTGHAVAKGAFLLLSADYRVGVQGDFKIGLNEVAIGMTMHNAGIALARGRLTDNFFTRSVLCAELFSPDDAVQAGFLDSVVEAGQFDAHVSAVAQQLRKLDMPAHRNTKALARKPWLEALDQAIDIDQHFLVGGDKG
ncbi:crotonase/enoyl-CoA hydratase family protein [Aestuariibacter halophilus]|uniref:Crotonase/enoyl-CoA hydratase family protein n=1 Tax=Fluctibacter halophilus TaxID=226011 RepID=A0ABS8GCM8_9ALTE|nr:crotonase/enoyl-CoA hydratase family protein [Aestuariibacter halophilus]MCC2618268.1 crotonase/enoyl-CoA hydratase family protein [Aestuariibacter halophilus]